MGLTTTTTKSESAVDELELNIDTTDNDDDDDDDEDDEDYNPTNNDDVDDDGDGDTTTATNNNRQVGEGDSSSIISENRSRLSPAKQRAVDEAFTSLFGNGAVATTTTNGNKRTKPTASSTSPSSKTKQRQQKLLQDIFGGSTIASKLIATSHRSTQGYDRGSSRKRSMSISNFAEEKVLVRETKRFAGQDIEVVRTAVVVRGDGDEVGGGVTLKKNDGEHSATASIPISSGSNTNTKPQGIDSLLSQIKGPQKISTMTKTDADWEVFKDHAGIEEELKKKAEGKDAFLVKKDFLDRVDVRKFEKEKEGRERERAVAAAAAVGRL